MMMMMMMMMMMIIILLLLLLLLLLIIITTTAIRIMTIAMMKMSTDLLHNDFNFITFIYFFF